MNPYRATPTSGSNHGTTTTVVSLPTAGGTVTAGDPLIIFVAGGGTVSSGPSGFTLQQSSAAAGGLLYTKTAGGSEPSTYTITWTANSIAVAVCVALNGSLVAATWQDPSSFPAIYDPGTTGSCAVPGITLGGSGEVLLGFFAFGQNTAPGTLTLPGSFTQQLAQFSSGAAASDMAMIVGDNQSVASGATGTITATSSATNFPVGWIIGIVAAGTAATGKLRQPVVPARRPPRRAIAGGVRGKTNLPLAPPPPTSSIRIPTPKHPRGLWRRVVGTAPPPLTSAVPPRLAPEARRPGPARGLWRRVTGTGNLPPVVTAPPRLPLPPRRFPPTRGLWRRATGTSNLPPVVIAIPRQPPQARRRLPARGLWRRVTGATPPSPVITTASLPGGNDSVAYTATLTATSGTPGYTWSVSSGSLPAGLGLNAATGVISGTPTASGSSFTITVTDSLGFTGSKPLSITIGAAPFDALPAPPTFPLTPLDVRTELLLGGTWTDISSYVVQGTGPISATRGHPDESTTTTPSGTSLTLNNRDARFTATNPTGPYYGQLVRNVPLRTSVPEGASYLRFEVDQFSYASCPDSAGVSVTGDMEIQLDISLDNWNQAQVLACKWGASSNQRTWILELLEDGRLLFNFSSNGTGIDSAPSLVPVPVPPLHRMCLRVTYLSSTGTVTFYTSPPGLSSPTWTQLGAARTFISSISLFDSTATVQIGGATDTDDGYPGVYGKIHAFQLLNGIAGTAVAAPDFTAQPAGPLNANPYFGPAAQLTSWGAFPAGAAIAWSGSQGYMGHGALVLTGSGAVATPQAFAEQDPATPGVTYTAGPWVMSPQGATAQVGINWWSGVTNTGGVYPAAVTLPAGIWTQLTASGAAPGGTTAVEMFVQLTGTPASSVQLIVSPAALTARSFADAQGNIWALNGTSEISNRKYRLHAETSAWPQSWDPTGTDVTVALTAQGVLRRMSQGTSKPLNSAMNRAYVRLSGSTAPVAYWPCEDGTQATQLASGLGGAAMQIAGAPSLASDSSFLCSLPIPVLSNSAWAGTVPPYTGGTDNVMRFLMHVPAGGDVNGAVIARMFTTGPVARADLLYGTGGTLELRIYSGAGTLLATSTAVSFNVNGLLLRVSVELQASGADLKYNITTLPVGAAVGSSSSNTLTSTAAGNATQAAINPGGLLASTAIGQISVQPAWSSLFDLAGPLDAWQGEPAGVRFKRLCDEEGVGFRGQGSLHDTVAMGPQSAQALTTLLQECVDADRGAMVEPRQVLALGYRTRGSMLNQAPAVTLPYSMLMFPLGETEDDQIVQNDVTAQNADGSFSEQVQASGPLSVQSPPAGVGRYDVSVPVNIAADSALDSEAAWILHMGTVAEPRYPQIDIDLATAEAAIVSRFYDLLDLDLGDRLVITSPPPWLPPGSIDQLIQGVTENIGIKVLNMAWAGVPQSPWNVLVWNDPVWGRWTTAGATLHTSISSGATSMLVDSPNSLWTTAGGDFPFDILMSGERVTVTNITGASSPQTFTIVRAVNGVSKAQTAGAAVDLFYPPIWSL